MVSELRDRLLTISEELADAALERLRAAVEGDPHAAAEEKRITRARNAVDKAVHLLEPVERVD